MFFGVNYEHLFWSSKNRDEAAVKLPIVCTPPPNLQGGGVAPLTKFSKRVGLTRPQTLERGCWERGGDFFQGGCNFHIKNKLKSKIFNDKKSL